MMNEELSKANEEKAIQGLSLARHELAQVSGRNLEQENRQLQAEVKRLQSAIAESIAKLDEETCRIDEMNELRAHLAEETRKIQSKDERIAKLERSKLTKEKIAAIKACKVR